MQDELYKPMTEKCEHDKVPDFDHYDDLLRAVSQGGVFISTDELLLPLHTNSPLGKDTIQVQANPSRTSPLRVAEVVWVTERRPT